jgi:hypothetical protein
MAICCTRMHYSFERVALHRFLIQYFISMRSICFVFPSLSLEAITFFSSAANENQQGFRFIYNFRMLLMIIDFFFCISSIIEGEKKRNFFFSLHDTLQGGEISAEKSAWVVCCPRLSINKKFAFKLCYKFDGEKEERPQEHKFCFIAWRFAMGNGFRELRDKENSNYRFFIVFKRSLTVVADEAVNPI